MQNTNKRGVIYINPNSHQPYTEAEARYIDYWIGMGFNPLTPEFQGAPVSALTPELIGYEIAVYLN